MPHIYPYDVFDRSTTLSGRGYGLPLYSTHDKLDSDCCFFGRCPHTRCITYDFIGAWLRPSPLCLCLCLSFSPFLASAFASFLFISFPCLCLSFSPFLASASASGPVLACASAFPSPLTLPLPFLLPVPFLLSVTSPLFLASCFLLPCPCLSSELLCLRSRLWLPRGLRVWLPRGLRFAAGAADGDTRRR